MFTGLVEEIGTVTAVERSAELSRMAIACSTVLDGAAVGDSIAVSGVCLTVTELHEDGFDCELMGETLQRTALGDAAPGRQVNLERAMRVGDRLGGHLVQGHVDGVAEILAVTPHEEWTTVRYTLPAPIARYVVEKGSITVDGTSLTVTAVGDDWFEVGLIPHTLAVTTHGTRGVGDRVNLEVDVIAKYVERLLADRPEATAATARARQA